MRAFKICAFFLPVLGLIVLAGSPCVVMAGETDLPHKTHLDHLRGQALITATSVITRRPLPSLLTTTQLNGTAATTATVPAACTMVSMIAM